MILMRNKTSIAIHGGAGTILKSEMTPEKEKAYKDALSEAILLGDNILSNGGTAIAAVEAAVVCLEDCELFNAGKGSVYTADGNHEMDASIMCGKSRDAGATAAVSSVKNPIVLAREIMENSPHVFMIGEGAKNFAIDRGITLEKEEYFHNEFRYQQWMAIKGSDKVQLDHSQSTLKDKKFGTVGAVALDQFGNIAAATSTGGMTNKKFGRVGDSPMIGSGNYANNQTCAVSCTGDGEFFIRGVVAYDISALMEYKGLSLQEACDEVVHKRLIEIKGEGGVIATNTNGDIAMVFNSAGMYRASKKEGEEYKVEIYK